MLQYAYYYSRVCIEYNLRSYESTSSYIIYKSTLQRCMKYILLIYIHIHIYIHLGWKKFESYSSYYYYAHRGVVVVLKLLIDFRYMLD